MNLKTGITSISVRQNLRLFAPLFGILFSIAVNAQDFEYVYRNPQDSSTNAYLVVLPQGPIRGMVVRDYTTLPSMQRESPYQYPKLCSEAGLLCLYTDTSTEFPELFIEDSSMFVLEHIMREVITKYKVPEQNIFIGGISASGARALRFAEYCLRSNSALEIRGVFAVDAPLDLARFYYSASNHRESFKEGMRWEADFMIPKFEEWFGGGPDSLYQAYKMGSVFSHLDSLGGNAHYLKQTDLILFHEPDIDWWLNERGASYYDINSFDLVAFTQKLRDLGNEEVQLITTSGKGFNPAGERNCHSWTIVDEKLLVDWMLDRCD